MKSPKTPKQKSDHMVTFVIIPHHGGAMHQWRVPRWFLFLAVMIGISSIGGAWWVLSQEVNYRVEAEQVRRFKETNIKVAKELTLGREALLKVARLEFDLRKMLAYKNKDSLLKESNTGGPTPEDARKLQALLDSRDDRSLGLAHSEVTELMMKVEEREKSFNKIRKYVAKKRSYLASRPSVWPVRGWISSDYGARPSPFSGEARFHSGLDIVNDRGTPIRATADGTVRFSGWEGGYGKLVVLDHDNGFTTYYGHCDSLKVSVGQKVRRGTLIARMGSTGESTGPHVHYEIRRFGAPVNPRQYLSE